MMNSEQVNAYLEKKHAEEKAEIESKSTESVAAPENKDVENKVQESNTVEGSEDTTENKTGSETEEVVTKPSDEKPHVEEKKEKKEYTQQEKIDFAFQKEKAKRKKLEARIKELEAQIQKGKDAKLEDFDNNQEKFLTHQSEQMFKNWEKKKLEDEYYESKNAEAAETNARRIKACFPEEADQERYNELVKANGVNFVKQLDEEDPEQVILGYLDDSDNAPLLISVMMSNDDCRNEILSKSTPYGRQRAMERLEEKIIWAKEQMAKKKSEVAETEDKVKQTQTQTATKPAVPVIGSVTKSDNVEGPIVKDYNSVLHNLNNRRYRQ